MSYEQLTLKQRFQLETLMQTMPTQKEIAAWMRISAGTVSRELRRNGKDSYEARSAHSLCRRRRKEAKRRTKKLLRDKKSYAFVEEHITIGWSPQQIAGRLRCETGLIICHETIYDFIYTEEKQWSEYLRRKKNKYRRKKGTKTREKCREEAKKKRIDTRPLVVESRERIGDWEGDTIVGGEKVTGIITHVERRSGYLLGDLFLKKKAEVIKIKTVARFKKIAADKKYTITYDNGTEFSEYELTGRETGMDIYFAYPYHSWERGTNENANGLLRQFFPKKSMFAKLKQKDVDRAVKLINNRPRKRLGYLTPYEVFIEGKNCSSK